MHIKNSDKIVKLQTKANFGGLDILVSNAAVNPTVGHVLDSTEEVWDKIFDINVKSTFLLMKDSLPLLKCSKSPSIIIISSISGYNPFSVSLFENIFSSIFIYSLFILKEFLMISNYINITFF